MTYQHGNTTLNPTIYIYIILIIHYALFNKYTVIQTLIRIKGQHTYTVTTFKYTDF